MAGVTVEKLYAALTAEERAEVDRHMLKLRPKPKGVPLPGTWRERVPKLFPRYASAPFADRHVQMWTWADAVTLEGSPDPFTGFWPRGGAKSTTAEMIVAYLGARGTRRYGLYVRMTQDMADKSVNNIAALFESPEMARYYPEHAERAVGKFGNAKGWRRNQLRTAGGFTLDAIGLDVAARGIKIEDQRPDFIIFDDIDDALDTPATTKKKEDTITHSILPAGSNNCAVLFIQNLIIRDGIASRLADGRAGYMTPRIVSGPFPAVEGLKWEWREDAETGTKVPVITAGRATWAGQPLEACQKLMRRFGPVAFLKECQHQVRDRAEGIALRYDRAKHGIDLTDDQCRELVAMGRVFGGIDFGHWRFAFTLWAVDRKGVLYRIDELFSQRESLSTRAQRIHELCTYYGITGMLPIWGDAANPQDIVEINHAFKRGWIGPDGQHVTSRLRVVAVAMENKLRKVGIARMNDLLDRMVLRVRRGVSYAWHLGMNAGSAGTLMEGSRFEWEIENWAFPLPKEGEAQEEDADDDTADGADMMASGRYAVMSWWSKAKALPDYGYHDDDQAWEFEYQKRDFREPAHVADLLVTGTGGRRRPRVTTPRARGRR